MIPVLVLNAGSSSLKYQLIDLSKTRRPVLASGLVERIGERGARSSTAPPVRTS